MTFLATINQKLAIGLTRAVGTMWCAYVFALLALAGFPGLHAAPAQYVQWTSQTLIQLVMLSVIMVGQRYMSETQAQHHAENLRLHQQTRQIGAAHQAMQRNHAADISTLTNDVAALKAQVADRDDSLATHLVALHTAVASLAPPPAPTTPPTPRQPRGKKTPNDPDSTLPASLAAAPVAVPTASEGTPTT